MAAGQAAVSIPPVRMAGNPPHAQQGLVGAMVFTDNKQQQLMEETRKRKMTAGSSKGDSNA